MSILCLEFINSSWYINHRLFSDPLRDMEWLMKLAYKWNIKALPRPTEKQLSELINMRSEFTELLDKAVKGNKLTDGDIKLVNDYMVEASFYRQFQEDKSSLKLCIMPESSNWSWFMAEIAASFAKLYTTEAVTNLKICQNPECGWFFIDESKSGNRKWCDDTCASLMKVRRFRQKHKESNANE